MEPRPASRTRPPTAPPDPGVIRPDAEPAPARQLPGTLAPLGYRDYALYWIGLATTRGGRSIEELGAVWLMYELTGSPILLGLLGLFRAVPAIVLGPIAGVFSDRIDQRRLLLVTQGLGLLASLALGVMIVTGRVEFWHIYLQVAAQASIDSFDSAARQALFPRLVARRHLPEAVTISSTAGRIATLIGPAIGGVAIANLGVASPFLLNAASFVGLLVAVAAMHTLTPAAERSARSSFRIELTDGLRHIRSQPILSGLLKLELVFGVLQLNSVIITIVGREILGVGPEGLGGLLSAAAFGALAGTTYLLVVGHAQRQGRFVIGCMLAYAVALFILAASTIYVLSFAAIAAMGLLDSLSTVTRHSVMQLATPGHIRGRVMANMGTVTRGTGPTAELLSGLLSGLAGGAVALVAAATTLVAAAGITARTNRTLWRFSRDDVLVKPESPADVVDLPVAEDD